MLKNLRDKYGAIAGRMRAMAADDSAFTEEQRTEWNTLEQQLADVERQIKFAEQVETNSNPADAVLQEQRDRANFEARRKSSDPDNADPNRPITQLERLQAFSAWALGVHARDEAGLRAARRCGIDLRSGQLSWKLDRGRDVDGNEIEPARSVKELRDQQRRRNEAERYALAEYRANPEYRAQSVGTASAGGNTVPDAAMMALEESMLAWGGMRRVATIRATDTGAPLPVPTVDDTGNKGAIVAENTAVTEQDLAFGQKTLGAFKYTSKMVRCSVELMQDSAVNLAQYLGAQLGTRIGRITNDHFTTGVGTTTPWGIVTRAGDSTLTATAGTPLFSDILKLVHSVDPAYRDGAAFMVHDTGLLKLRSMVDGQSRPIWEPSIQVGEPSTLYGYPVIVNQSMPTWAATNKALIFGALNTYMIRDVREITIMRLDERYAELAQVAFLGFSRHDGDLLDAGTDPVKYLTAA